MAIINVPRLLVPKKEYDYRKWAVIACDQFTSQKEYWEKLDAISGDTSTLRLIFPEYYLSVSNEEQIAARIAAIHARMNDYVHSAVFDEVDDFVLVERTLPTGGVRIGLVVAIDLEEYDYRPEAAAHIRATEATVESRLPIRVRIRDGARLEFTHALLLVDDRREGVVERVYARRNDLPLLYDFDLNMGGGHLRGYRVTDSEAVLSQLTAITQGKDFQFAVGDGNHSIASAKKYWEKIKAGLSPEERLTHPARYATVELINLHSDGLTFHPIHRVVTGADFEDFLREMKGAFHGEGKLNVLYNGGTYTVDCDRDATAVIEKMAAFIADYLARHPAVSVDYIHGEEHLNTVCTATDGIGVVMPCMQKSDLFPYVQAHGVLPKKAFSLGEAEEKRYYMEGKLIR